MRTTTAALTAVFPLLLAGPALAGPVRVAVAGVSGDARAEDLGALAQDLRAGLAHRLDPAVFSVVSRDEMKRVYAARGAGCSPDDARCLVAASKGWDGRLFLRAHLAQTPQGLIFSVALDSVRGVRVARAAATVEAILEARRAIAPLLEDVAAQERAYRASMGFTPAAPAPSATTTTATWTQPPAAAPVAAPVAEAPTVCHGSPNGLPAWGDLVLDDEGVSFRSSGGFGKEWHRRWSEIRGIHPYLAYLRPALYITPESVMQNFGIRFHTSDARDRCLNELERRWREHR